MKKILLIFCGLVLLLQSLQTVFAEMLLFVGQECIYCQKLEKYLNENDFYKKFDIQTYEIYHNETNLMFYVKTSQDLGYKGGAVPLLVDGKVYEDGADDIIAYLAPESAQSSNQDQPLSETKLSKSDSEMLNAIVKEEATESEAEVPEQSSQGPEGQTFSITNLLIFAAVLIASAILYFLLGKKK